MHQPWSLCKLPRELLDQILGYFCIHCQYGDAHFHGGEALVSLGSDVFEIGRQGRAALASLSRTCKSLAAIVQPVLFHFYHTGNQPQILDTGEWDNISFEPGRAEDDMLLPFIRTLLDRPDLARHTRALAFYRSRAVRAAVESDTRTMTRVRALIMQELVTKDYFELYAMFHQFKDIDRWLADVVLALTPNIEQVLVGSNNLDLSCGYCNSMCALEQVRYAAFVGIPKNSDTREEGNVHLFTLRPLLKSRPHLVLGRSVQN